MNLYETSYWNIWGAFQWSWPDIPKERYFDVSVIVWDRGIVVLTFRHDVYWWVLLNTGGAGCILDTDSYLSVTCIAWRETMSNTNEQFKGRPIGLISYDIKLKSWEKPERLKSKHIGVYLRAQRIYFQIHHRCCICKRNYGLKLHKHTSYDNNNIL